MWNGNPRRGLWRAAGDINYDGVLDGLAAGVMGIERAAHVFVGLQQTIFCIARVQTDGQVRCIKVLAQRVGVLAQDGIAHVVDEVIFVDGDESMRGTRPLDPNLASRRHGGYGMSDGDGDDGQRLLVARQWSAQRLGGGAGGRTGGPEALAPGRRRRT